MAARSKLIGKSIYLTQPQAPPLLEQFLETTTYRGWQMRALGIMSNHIHLLVGVPGDPEPDTLLRDYKAYGSRKLNRLYGKPESGTWWTEGGSKRKKTGNAVEESIEYIRDQYNPLLIWIEGKIIPPGERGGVSPLILGGRLNSDSATVNREVGSSESGG